MFVTFVHCCFRGGAELRGQRAGALPGGCIAVCNNRHSVHYEAQVADYGGGVQACQECAADHITEPQLHGPAVGVGAGLAGHGGYLRDVFRSDGLQAGLPSMPLDSPVQ